MVDIDNNSVARQVELILRKLGSISTLPEVAAVFLPHFAGGRLNIASVTGIIESDPALTAKVFSLAAQRGVEYINGRPSVAQALANIPESEIRDAALSVKVFRVFDPGRQGDTQDLVERKQLAIYSLAVACCAKQIAGIICPLQDRSLAFSAGLLSNIGKIAINDMMPKSFAKITAEARGHKSSFSAVARKHLGLDHSVIGKRLAEKWHLPYEIILSIWLQNSDVDAVSQALPSARIALIVKLASIIARHAAIGQSGDFDKPAGYTEIAETLMLSADQVEEISRSLPDKVKEKCRILGFDNPGADIAYCDLISETAAGLARSNTALTEKNNSYAADMSQTLFINNFLMSARPGESVIDIAVQFAVEFKKHYQTGPVCLYLQPDENAAYLDAVTVDDSGDVNAVLLQIPVDSEVIPYEIQRRFDILSVVDSAPWLFDQVEVDITSAKIVPMLVNGTAIGALVFTERMPVDPQKLKTLLSVSTSIAANVIGMKYALQKQSDMAERFAELLGKLHDDREEISTVKAISSIAEMAAGAGHELNNPLAVISGRAQLLFDTESDENKKQMLKQIQQRTEEISDIITDLMEFAKPAASRPSEVSVRTVLDKAIKDVAGKRGIEKMEVEISGMELLGNVNVDIEQVSRAVGSILINALESYKGGSGPVTIDGSCMQQAGSVTIQIADQGCGMDRKTLSKACEPFFSAKPAGRNRGMGLAHAQRLLKLNNSTMTLDSTPDRGTTVTITMPEA